MSILDDVRGLTPEQTSLLLSKLGDADSTLAALRHEVAERSAADGLFFLKWVKTRDEADPRESSKSFPIHHEYIRLLWHALTDNQKVIVAKSRQMLVSWIMCAFCIWWARFISNQAVYFQAQKWEDAAEKIALAKDSPYLGRCHFMEVNLPAFLRQPIKATEGCLMYPNGSIIQALPGGADQIRGKVVSVYVGDEFAYQTEARGTWTAVAPLIQKGSKIFLISTPNGSENQFATLYHGRSDLF